MMTTEDDDDPDETVQCPACEGIQAVSGCQIGLLGGTAWCRCRGCGMLFTAHLEDLEEEKSND